MLESSGDLWAYHKKGHFVVIPTNGTVKTDGMCVMGKGLARSAAVRFSGLPYALGEIIDRAGNHVAFFPAYTLFTFPTKNDWWDHRSNLSLIEQSCKELVVFAKYVRPPIYLPRVGCGVGLLKWEDVLPVLQRHLNDDFVALSNSDLEADND